VDRRGGLAFLVLFGVCGGSLVRFSQLMLALIVGFVVFVWLCNQLPSRNPFCGFDSWKPAGCSIKEEARQ
jgi:hypothetical protein